MDFYILHDGQETGPHSEETARTLLERGDANAGDLAWHEGLPDWAPLGELLADPGAKTPQETPEPAAEISEPASPKQKALLSFLGVALPVELSRDQAALLIHDAKDDPANAPRLILWEEERFRLCPDLFAAEIQAKKENRAAHFSDLCQSAGAQYFNGVGKAHCQVLVAFLDVKFPNWDARESGAAEHYFFPAVAEKFPQLVKKQWRGRLHYGHGLRVAPQIAHSSPTTNHPRKSATTPLTAITRGVILGLVILGGLYAVQRTMEGTINAAVRAETSADEPPARPVTLPQKASSPPVEKAAASLPAIEPLPTLAPPKPAPAAIEGLEPLITPPAPEPAMTAAALSPMPDTPMPSPPAPESAASRPPFEVNPTLTATTPPAATTLATKTDLLLTKPVEVQLTYGRIVLPPGTPVKLIARQGTLLRVSSQNSVILVPASSTDLD